MTCRICAGCNHDIGYGNYLGCMGAFFHPQCFRCHACGYPITEHEVSRVFCSLIININICSTSMAMFFFLILLFWFSLLLNAAFFQIKFSLIKFLLFFIFDSSSLCQGEIHTTNPASKSSITPNVKSVINL